MTDLPAAAYRQSFVQHEGADYWLEKVGTSRQLVVKASDSSAYAGLDGASDGDTFRADTTADNALELRNRLPWLKPQLFGLATSVGTGDRLGICTPGHARAFKSVGGGLKPVFAQQSIREMGRCHREPRNVLDDATWGAFQEGWTAGVGADADHLHTTADIDRCAEAGFVFYTLDPNEYVDPEAEGADEATIRSKAAALDWASLDSSQEQFLATYVGHRIDLEHESITLDEESVLRAMAKYGPSMANAMDLYRHLQSLGIPHEVEFAVDETDYPTKPAEHVVVVSELKRLGMEFVSFAPRFVGGFEKGVEYIGDLAELTRDFEIHAEIAKALGPYKLSLHSGSDKYSTYPLFAEATGGVAHLKTAGTSWAEALRVIARHDGDLMREITALALESFEQSRKSYHLSCDPAKVPSNPTDAQLATLLDVVDSRQVLHVGYGAILDAFGPRMYEVWLNNDEELYGIIEEHFVKHLAPFAH